MIAEKYTKRELQNMIPGLTVYKIDQARQYASLHGPGSTMNEKAEKFHRSRMEPEKLEHALSFFFDPQFIQLSSFGTRELKLENGDKIMIPEVVRSTCSSNLVNMYISYCKENEFVPLSSSTLYKILSSCSSATKTNLRGLDNTAADGSSACDDLTELVKNIASKSVLTKDETDEILLQIKCSKLYMKTDYKLHIKQNDECADHCINLALSDPSDALLQNPCQHTHNIKCDRCELFPDLIKLLKEKISNTNVYDQEQKCDLLKEMEIAESKVTDWKSHVLRTINQDEGRMNLLENLNPNQMLIVMDWAMKFLPSLHREKQSDFYGQKGFSWHISVCIFKDTNGKLKHETFAHLFNLVKQDWFAVASILENVLVNVRVRMPIITEVFLRSDNAGCYHTGLLWQAIHGISERTDIFIQRYDYSEAQSGKSYCDSKIAHMRRKMRMYVASGGNIQNPVDMRDAILSGKGVVGCRVAVAEINTEKQQIFSHKWKGVQNITNLGFMAEKVIIWKAYGIGNGNSIPMSEVKKMSCDQEETALIITHDFNDIIQTGSVTLPKKRANPVQSEDNVELEQEATRTEDLENLSNSSSSVFNCSEIGCTKQYQFFSKLQNHIEFGRHVYKLERKSTYDDIKLKWADVCKDVDIRLRNLEKVQESLNEINEHQVDCGWALRKGKKVIRHSKAVKDYLLHLFTIGQTTGKKISPSEAALLIRNSRDEEGRKMFQPEEYLLTSQVASYFSRLALLSRQNQLSRREQDNLNDEDLAAVLSSIEENEVRQNILQTH
ncbi:uncharacterized protein LOC143058541 isoform X1 [Mytilus galloprovincialis]|uniref:uncharacterized protein LOC143058541 isoform X1 n=3 Tax=Mytilus galloprovincialis TaxID=29158 RepID=UPI003F7B42A3